MAGHNASKIAELNGVEVLEAPHILPSIRRQITAGLYERPEVEGALANLQNHDRIVELGTGAGIVGAIMAKNFKGVQIRSFEANPNLIKHANALYTHNKIDSQIRSENFIVTAQDNPADTVEFMVRDNFLGSRLSSVDSEGQGQSVAVPTYPYSKLKGDFDHNVLVMDIEGAEQEFLENADLNGVELIMLEVHPKTYGSTGLSRCANALKRKGFVSDKVTSQGNVWCYKTPARMTIPIRREHISSAPPITSYSIDPKRSMANDVETHKDARMTRNARTEGFSIEASVYGADRRFIQDALCWTRPGALATQPINFPRPIYTRRLPGHWLFGGRYHPHFGHFLTETISRLWVLDEVKEHLNGVVYFPVYNNFPETALQSFTEFFSIFNRRFVWEMADNKHKVDQLVVGPQGVGLDRLMLGSPEFRDFVKRHLNREFEPTGVEKLYISRSRVSDRARKYLGEEALEKLLEKEGYTVIHPQELPWAEQLRYYLSAKQIISPDGSPLHLVNYTGRRDLSVAVISRRPDNTARLLARQGLLFGLQNAIPINALNRLWSTAGVRRANVMLTTEVQFEPLCAALKENGFISDKARWKNLSESAIQKELVETGQAFDRDMIQVPSAGHDLTERPHRSDAKKIKVIPL